MAEGAHDGTPVCSPGRHDVLSPDEFSRHTPATDPSAFGLHALRPRSLRSTHASRLAEWSRRGRSLTLMSAAKSASPPPVFHRPPQLRAASRVRWTEAKAPDTTGLQPHEGVMPFPWRHQRMATTVCCGWADCRRQFRRSGNRRYCSPAHRGCARRVANRRSQRRRRALRRDRAAIARATSPDPRSSDSPVSSSDFRRPVRHLPVRSLPPPGRALSWRTGRLLLA